MRTVSVCDGPLPLGGAAAEGDQPGPLRVLLPYRLGFIRPELFYGGSGLFLHYIFLVLDVGKYGWRESHKAFVGKGAKRDMVVQSILAGLDAGNRKRKL